MRIEIPWSDADEAEYRRLCAIEPITPPRSLWQIITGSQRAKVTKLQGLSN